MRRQQRRAINRTLSTRMRAVSAWRVLVGGATLMMMMMTMETAPAHAEEGARATSARDHRPEPPPHRLIDVGARTGYSLPVGAYDVGTHAFDTSFGGVPLAIDATVRLGSPSRWNVTVGGFFSLAPTIPKLCGSVSECTSSIGSDLDIAALARVRGPRTALRGFVLPEAEIGTGWSWSTRSLVDADSTSTRRWNGPLLIHAALIPTFALGSRARLGVIFGGSVAATASSHLDAPGIDNQHTNSARRLHGTLDIGVRLGVDLFDEP